MEINKNTSEGIINFDFEVNLKNRWYVEFDLKDRVEKYVVTRMDRPKVRKLPWYLLGLTIIEPLTITFIEPIGGDLSGMLFTLFKNNKKFNFTINMVDSRLDTMEEWCITDAKIKKIDFGELDYKLNELVEIKIQVKPSRLKLIY